MKLVFAGNYQMYREYLKESGETPRTARYVSSPEKALGYTDYEIILYDDWFIHEWADEVVKNLRQRQSCMVVEESVIIKPDESFRNYAIVFAIVIIILVCVFMFLIRRW